LLGGDEFLHIFTPQDAVGHCQFATEKFGLADFAQILVSLKTAYFLMIFTLKATNPGYCMLYKKSITLFLVNHSIALL